MKDITRPTSRTAGATKSTPDAETLAVSALSFIASDPVLMPRFLAMSGIEASDIRRAAAEPGFLAGVLNFLLAHEPSLMAFCEATGSDPAQVGRAAQMLPGGDGSFDRST
ncbi:DUF3572 domain-containing protein [Aquibium oceanicum]|uniref:DUF3572 domain-containing protein n=1 Tax=Aquibium oceanicum TaxID=1670800 RepID=A0A1L3SRP4_9HYPH|nr:DUF3572 domain-containing protein [Aquibium oceanicum]APH72066.1 hypothetical protein BSQ44_12375 [Aquibium oceanicum]